MKFGFAVHFVGMFADMSMVLRVRSRNVRYRLMALVAVLVYTFFFVAWLLALHFVRFNHVGKVCSGDFEQDKDLPNNTNTAFAKRQGQVL